MTGLELKVLRKEKGITQEVLADLLSITSKTVKNWEKSEEIKESNVKIIHALFRGANNIDVNDPLTYFKTKAGSNYEELPGGKLLITVPLIPIKAHATYISEHVDAEYISEFQTINFIVDRVGKGLYRAFEIMGDSMNDGLMHAIPDGAIVLGRQLGKQHWIDRLRVNHYPYWIIIHKDTIMCKEIVAQDVENGIITCHSLNASPEFKDFDVELNDVHELYNIIRKQL